MVVSVVDIIGVLTQTNRARKYWSDLKKKLMEEGEMRLTDCVNTKNAFRIIQSIPSKPKFDVYQFKSQMQF
jgi:hypothetical protein